MSYFIMSPEERAEMIARFRDPWEVAKSERFWRTCDCGACTASREAGRVVKPPDLWPGLLTASS